MDERTMNRRGVLRGAGAVGAVALAGVAGAPLQRWRARRATVVLPGAG